MTDTVSYFMANHWSKFPQKVQIAPKSPNGPKKYSIRSRLEKPFSSVWSFWVGWLKYRTLYWRHFPQDWASCQGPHCCGPPHTAPAGWKARSGCNWGGLTGGPDRITLLSHFFPFILPFLTQFWLLVGWLVCNHLLVVIFQPVHPLTSSAFLFCQLHKEHKQSCASNSHSQTMGGESKLWIKYSKGENTDCGSGESHSVFFVIINSSQELGCQ